MKSSTIEETINDLEMQHTRLDDLRSQDKATDIFPIDSIEHFH